MSHMGIRRALDRITMRLRLPVISLCLASVTFASLALATPPVPRASPPRIAPHVEAHAEAPKPHANIPVAFARDWHKSPAIVEHVTAGEILAVSDLHGHYAEAFKLFEGNGILRGNANDPSHVEWTGGSATLVIVGDSINKGAGSVPIIDMLRHLQAIAPLSGGRVIVTLGNHEADFLHEPMSERSLRDGTDETRRFGIGHELVLHGESPAVVASGNDAAGRGRWLRGLPFAAQVNDTFFVHSGNSRGMDKATLATSIERAVGNGNFGHDEIIGPDDNSVLGADNWTSTANAAHTNAQRLGVKRIVMGHIPDAFDARGSFAGTPDGALLKIDTGLGNDVGEARLLRIDAHGAMKQLNAGGVPSVIRLSPVPPPATAK